MPLGIEQALKVWLASGLRRIGQILIEENKDRFTLCHRDDHNRDDLVAYDNLQDAATIAKFDDAGNYRALKTAPTLRHGWMLEVSDFSSLHRALDLFYPGRIAVFLANEKNRLVTTPLRTTLARQSGMYRIAASITDAQADALVARFCRSIGGAPGCLRTILWKRDAAAAPASAELPPEKFDAFHDQTGCGDATIPLLCQEPCNLLVAEARKMVKADDPNTARGS